MRLERQTRNSIMWVSLLPNNFKWCCHYWFLMGKKYLVDSIRGIPGGNFTYSCRGKKLLISVGKTTIFSASKFYEKKEKIDTLFLFVVCSSNIFRPQGKTYET